MSTIYSQNGAIFMLRRGTSDDPYIPITENIPVKNGKVTLREVPDFCHHVIIPNYFEVYPNIFGMPYKLRNNEFWVDYNSGIMYFKETEEGKTINNISYLGTGVVYFPDSRIYVTGQSNNDVITTLSEILNEQLKETEDFHLILNNFKWIGNYDNTTTYKPYNIITFHGSTYINKVECCGVLPSNISNWTPLSLGYADQQIYDNTKQYEFRDVVYYEPEKTIYLCTQRTLGHLPTDTTYWYPMLSVKYEAQYAMQQGDYAKSQGNKLNNFKDKGEYNTTAIYDKWNTVTHNSETYISLIDNNINNTPGLKPDAWSRVARRGLQGEKGIDGVGLVPKGVFNKDTTYVMNNLVTYENGLYYCTAQPPVGTLPTNTNYWQLLLSEYGTVLMTTSNVPPNNPYVGEIWRKTNDVIYATNKLVTTSSIEPTVMNNGGIWRKVK